MEAYPEDLLVGVFPLVFCVNAILETETEKNKRSVFDKFLDAFCAILLESDLSQDTKDDDDSDMEDYRPHGALSGSLYAGFKSSAAEGSNKRGRQRPSFASALSQGQAFFQRARIEPVSSHHGFPPSQNPEGRNIEKVLQDGDMESLKFLFSKVDGIWPSGWLEKHVHALPSTIIVVCSVQNDHEAQSKANKHLYQTVEHLYYSLVPKRPCKIHVVGLLENVTFIQGDAWSRLVTNQLLGEDVQSSDPLVQVSVLRPEDLSTDGASTEPLRRLHRAVRTCSRDYYRRQAQRCRSKLDQLLSSGSKGSPRQRRRKSARTRFYSSIPPPLYPLVIRYCFQIGLFYEFQWRHEPALQYLNEAYRHCRDYYRYLQGNTTIASGSASFSDLETDSEHTKDTTEGVEVSLTTPKVNWANILPPVPDDMKDQCRAVGEWLHLKLMLAGFYSNTSEGFASSRQQWNQHLLLMQPTGSWHDWVYNSRQRLVLSQLMDRHTTTEFAAWKVHQGAVEALLNLARSLETAPGAAPIKSAEDDDKSMRLRYVGCLDNPGQALEQEKQVKHREMALDLILKGVAVFEKELEETKRGFFAQDEFTERSSSRTGARLYYLAGGLLLAHDRHPEAFGQLEKASKLSKGWRELELSIRQLLIECYERHLPLSSESSQTLADMILDSYFNAEMSSTDLRRALKHFASISGGDSLKWYHDTVNEDDQNLPFSFQVTFPKSVFATAGDTIDASIQIRSNLDYAVHINKVTLVSLAGELPVPTNDLLGAANASEGDQGKGIIIQRMSYVTIGTRVQLPKDLSNIAVDDAGNGGELQGTAGKGSFAKSARPRTSGITSAGGARLVSEEVLSKNSVTQGWSMRYLGGKPLRCDGLKLTFYPVQVEKTASVESITLIELFVEKKKARTAANIKRTPFEEENYITSAWSRPASLPLQLGPRSIRVLDPQPQLSITNLTEPVIDGSAFEGTVNRIVLQLHAGPNEHCTDIKIKITCFTVMLTPSGVTKRLVTKEEVAPENEGSVDMDDPSYRTPSLVSRHTNPQFEGQSHGNSLPLGWEALPCGESSPERLLPSLKNGEATLVHVDIYRPPPLQDSSMMNVTSQEDATDNCMCKTDFYVTVSYKQERPARPESRRKSSRRSVRARPVMSRSVSKEGGIGEASLPVVEAKPKKMFDEVSLEYNSSVVWKRPLTATLSAGAKQCDPSGSRHPSNSLMADKRIDLDDGEEMALVDGETVIVCSEIHADESMRDLKAELKSVKVEYPTSKDEPLDLQLVSSLDGDSTVYKARGDEFDVLSPGSSIFVSYATVAKLRSDYKKGSVSARLGSLVVEWAPSPMDLELDEKIKYLGPLVESGHGPLDIGSPLISRFPGPACYIESPPFETYLCPLPSQPQVYSPFQLSYSIENKTNQHQTLLVNINLGEGGIGRQMTDDLLVSGLVSGELQLGPRETQQFCYTIVPTKTGKTFLPGLGISSLRHNTWVIKQDQDDNARSIFVVP